ncbi:MAG: CoA-transferase [Candidatus Kariarchaeaceae archaeon]|jgi:acyl CoA:acetate/3-ketoacid CoA transferase alpha subunit/acyl CoA:acetate/3-ketoacid CoA transferase beta subunit
MEVHSKIITLDEITDRIIPDGSTIAIGGVHSHNVPMALVRQILRIGVKDLTLIGSISAGLPIDLLVGMDRVKNVYAPYVGFEMWGLVPIYTLRAASNGVTFQPFPPGLHELTSIPSQSDLYKKVKDPFTGEETYALEAIYPDVAIIHSQQADMYGNCVHHGSVVTDDLMASSAKTVIVTCDELVGPEVIRKNPSHTSIEGFYVDYVIPLQYGSHPTSSHGIYSYDAQEIKNYLKASRDAAEYQEFMYNRISIPETEYAAKFVNPENFGHTISYADEGEYTISELVASVFARDIKNGELGICGAVSDIPMAAMQLAERTEAPDMKWISGGSGYVNPRGLLVPSSTDFAVSQRAEAKLSMNDVIPIEMQEIDFFFAGGLQIDKMGNTNLAGIPSQDGWKLRGPGSVGLPFLSRAKRVYLYTLTHNKRTLVDTVSYISGPGHTGQENIRSKGPTLLVTNLCVFRWNYALSKWGLHTLHPGVTLQEVIENTGFGFEYSDNIPTTEIPTAKELNVLREIDPIGYLRGAMD